MALMINVKENPPDIILVIAATEWQNLVKITVSALASVELMTENCT
jgi:hypothetical protein